VGEKRTIAILAGNQSAPNLQNRFAGAKKALRKYPSMKLNDPGVFYDVKGEAAEAIQQKQNASPQSPRLDDDGVTVIHCGMP
jgi:ribose transport system substrate-binding protein